MATSLPGPSSLGRVQACLASEVLPHAEQSGAASRRGHVIHRFLKACGSGEGYFEERRIRALAEVPPEYRGACEAIDPSALPPLDPAKATAELSLAYDTSTGAVRQLGVDLEREEVRRLARPEEVVGTVDWAALSAGAFVALDWKTGHAEVDRAEVNMQFRTYGLLGARAFGMERAVVGGVRILEHGEPWYDVVELDALDLQVHEALVLGLLRARAQVMEEYRESGRVPRQVQGSHCRFCPAFSFCPAKSALLRSVLPGESGLPDFARSAPAALTAEQVGYLYLQVEQAEEVLERMKERLKDWVRAHGPAPLPEGAELREEVSVATSVRAELAEPLLIERLGLDFTRGLVRREAKLTREALRRRIADNLEVVWQHLLSVGQVTPGMRRSAAAAERALIDELGIAGAVEYTPTRRVEVRKEKPGRTRGPALPRGQGDE